ncbi:MAG TPA: PSP1 C-terminal domain-containing protein [Pirellulales bacterium]|jgi:cell fate regulator YaaT (PSP1 superfamily)|nr:PSP1 C-terminal domain-containing protein [Pirellulales bacterium]
MQATIPLTARHHLVRVGALGQVGRFTSVDRTLYPRGTKVVLRTSRGLELGEILAPPSADLPGATADGSILRGMTVEDGLLESRLQKNRAAAFSACEERLRRLNSPVALLEVEHLFDGRSLFFYFLGEVPPEVESLTHELAEVYDAEVQFRKFADTVTTGCGPGCGTDAATGGGCSTCATGCAIAGACGTKRG